MTGAARYDAVARGLHWLLAAALLAQIAFGLSLDEIAPRGTPARAPVINLHKSIGIVIGLLVLARLAWRLRHRPPPWPAAMTAAARRAAIWGHRALYVTMVVVPLAGYLASNFSRHGVRFFGHALPPWGPDRPAVYTALNGLHEVAAWLLIVLIAGHVAFAFKHAWIDRDGVFERMGPRPRDGKD